jgi:hypothetical protein
MAFALLVDVLQLRMKKSKGVPLKTHEHYLSGEERSTKGI